MANIFNLSSDKMSNLIKNSNSSVDLLNTLRLQPLSEAPDSNVSALINNIEDYFAKTNSSVLQILRSHTGTEEFEPCHPHKIGEEVNELLSQGCEFYMLPRYSLERK
jgi:hypothetical protein